MNVTFSPNLPSYAYSKLETLTAKLALLGKELIGIGVDLTDSAVPAREEKEEVNVTQPANTPVLR